MFLLVALIVALLQLTSEVVMTGFFSSRLVSDTSDSWSIPRELSVLYHSTEFMYSVLLNTELRALWQDQI